MIKNNCSYDYSIRDNIMYLILNGEVDHHSAVSVRQDIDTLICGQRPDKLILDLSRVGFMDSSGLGLIMGRYALIKQLGMKMCIINPSEATSRILDLAGIRRIIPVEYQNGGEEK